jgi:signal transduction histidine kinase
LKEHPAFVDAVGSVALFATENERLTEKLQSSLEELQRSRVRILTAADRERHRIERDLHDGAQQQLVALRIKLELADDLMETDSAHAHQLLREAESEIEDALDQVRSLARGIYPSLLADQGLSEALRAAALRVSLPTRVDCDGVTRYPAAIESAVYFTCLEALQNAVKHAHGASATAVSLSAGSELHFEVRDDGEGFYPADVALGKGITNMRDRIAAVGGRLDVDSVRGRGTVVSGAVPVAPTNGASRFSRNGDVDGAVQPVVLSDPPQ